MPTRRLILDRFLRRFTPRLDASFAPGPTPLGDGLWSVDRRLHLFGGIIPCRTVVARVGNGELVVIGAPALAARCAAGLAPLGRVTAVVAPNSFHYLYAAAARAAFPAASLFVAPGLAERIPALPPSRALDRHAASPWATDLEYDVLGPLRGTSEVVFYHRPSRAVVFTDIASNMVRHERPVDRWISRAYGMPASFGPSRNARVLLRVDRDESRRLLRRVLDWPFEAVVVAHGEAIGEDARRRFEDAFVSFL